MGRQFVLIATLSLLLLVIDLARGAPSNNLEHTADVDNEAAKLRSLIKRAIDPCAAELSAVMECYRKNPWSVDKMCGNLKLNHLYCIQKNRPVNGK